MGWAVEVTSGAGLSCDNYPPRRTEQVFSCSVDLRSTLYKTLIFSLSAG